MKDVRYEGDVGIWHETFKVRAGEYESVYGNMPVMGLAAAGATWPSARGPTSPLSGSRPDPDTPRVGVGAAATRSVRRERPDRADSERQLALANRDGRCGESLRSATC